MDVEDRTGRAGTAALTPYGSPERWAAGPDLVYGELARAAVALLPEPADHSPVLDAGAGTGAFTRALQARGATVIALDVSLPMLRYQSATRVPAIVGDVCSLPLCDSGFGAAVAGFVLSHVADPRTALAELHRVVRPGGTVLATAFPAGPDAPKHPAKAALDAVLNAHGYEPPKWYADLKGSGEERVGSAGGLLGYAASAGLAADARVTAVDVDLGALDAGALVRWRFGMPQVVPWLATLTPARREALTAAGLDAAGAAERRPLRMLVLLASVPSTARTP